MYRKVPAAAGRALFHVHVDAKEEVPEAALRCLLQAGYVRDDFLSAGSRGGPNPSFPVSHLTWKGGDAEAFRRAWLAADGALIASGVCAYLEGELVALDAVLDGKAKRQLDVDVFEHHCPLAKRDTPVHTFDCPRLDAHGSIVGSERRLLPIKVTKRPLCPQGEVEPGKAPSESGARDLFRASEVHLSVRRNGADPRLLALLGATGLSQPIIPKVVCEQEGALRLGRDGRPIVVEDMPLTLQAARDSPGLIALFDTIVRAALYEIGGIGLDDVVGVERTSVKYEPAVLFGFYHGRFPNGAMRRLFDPHTDLPEVVSSITDAAGRVFDLELPDRSIGGESIRIDPGLLPDNPYGVWTDIHRESAWTRYWHVRDIAAGAIRAGSAG